MLLHLYAAQSERVFPRHAEIKLGNIISRFGGVQDEWARH